MWCAPWGGGREGRWWRSPTSLGSDASSRGTRRRAEVSEELDLGDALDRYIDNSADLQEHRQELKTHALQLERELELGQQQEEGE